jgi:hypothetical protein
VEVLRGYHLLRHTFISICASQGVDQRLIDEWVEHQTEEQRKRYRHLDPSTQQQHERGPQGGYHVRPLPPAGRTPLSMQKRQQARQEPPGRKSPERVRADPNQRRSGWRHPPRFQGALCGWVTESE